MSEKHKRKKQKRSTGTQDRNRRENECHDAWKVVKKRKMQVQISEHEELVIICSVNEFELRFLNLLVNFLKINYNFYCI